jgi:AraC-like DNA-binding protein
MIADDREQQRARLQLEEKIANLEQQIQEKKDEVRLKYQNSRLNDDDKLRLQMAIRHGMENIDEVCKDDFSIDRLAEMCGENSKKISQVVNETYGCSFSTLLRHIRCKEACRRMDDHDNFGRYTIEAIGESVGFKSRTGFIRAFKNCIGLLPSEYMKLSHEQQ